ncbi:uncharacterized protein LOC142145739 [Mixophyes fleayi]|uniref:uncharacterized protein LOC142145739 n=1 Tax=Mixophyes fleayi TaxID=3061075 RepID=UPI003F4DD07B
MILLLSLLSHLLLLLLLILLPFLLLLLHDSYILPSRYYHPMLQVRIQQFTLGYWVT